MKDIEVFTHAMGMISVLKEHMAPDEDGKKRLGRFYILAPENSCSIQEGFSVDDFEEVWQYGSSPDNPNLWEVDGVAVQCQDLINMPEDNKIYLEDYNAATKQFQDFLKAHYGENYPWIFTAIDDDGKPGYVKIRE